MNECDIDEDGNVIDPITYETIPIDRLITFEQLGKKFCFDIDTLAEYVKGGKYDNPLNRQRLPTNIITSIHRYLSKHIISILYYDKEITLYDTESIGRLIIEVTDNKELIGMVGLTANGVDLYSYDLTSPISTIAIDRRIIVRSYPTLTNMGMRYHKLYRFSLASGIDWIRSIIPARYGSDPPPPIEPNQLDHKMISDFIVQADKKNVPIDYYINGITRLLNGAKISSKFADRLQKGIDLIAKRYPNGANRLSDMTDIIYGRVIDPYNLPTSSRHYRDRWSI